LDLQPVDLLSSPGPARSFAERFEHSLGSDADGFSSCRKKREEFDLWSFFFWSTKENGDDDFWSSLFLIVLT
jgi:hypothetical protein